MCFKTSFKITTKTNTIIPTNHPLVVTGVKESKAPIGVVIIKTKRIIVEKQIKILYFCCKRFFVKNEVVGIAHNACAISPKVRVKKADEQATA